MVVKPQARILSQLMTYRLVPLGAFLHLAEPVSSRNGAVRLLLLQGTKMSTEG